MAKATTFRLDPEIQAALALLSKVAGRSQNQLVNEAVRALVFNRTPEVEAELESLLVRLRRYQENDPTGEKSVAEAMKAEAALEEDPAEGPQSGLGAPAGEMAAADGGQVGDRRLRLAARNQS